MSKLGPILMGVAYLALVVFIIIFSAKRTSNFDDFSKYWGLFGTLIGVATGAIPSFFFKAQADNATTRAAKESTKAQLYASAADPIHVQTMLGNNPQAFS